MFPYMGAGDVGCTVYENSFKLYTYNTSNFLYVYHISGKFLKRLLPQSIGTNKGTAYWRGTGTDLNTPSQGNHSKCSGVRTPALLSRTHSMTRTPSFLNKPGRGGGIDAGHLREGVLRRQ